MEDLGNAYDLILIVDDGKLYGESCCLRDVVEAALPLLASLTRALGGDGDVHLPALT